MKSMFGRLRRSLAAGSISIGLLLSFTVATATAQIWNTNLVTNGDAEAGPSAIDRAATPITNIPGWTRSGSFTVIKYGSPQLYGTTAYGPLDRKSQYFCGGPNGGTAKAEQTIDLSAGAAEIDAGRVRFYLEAYLSNANENRDVMPSLTAVFYDSAGKAILTHKAVAQPKEDIRDAIGWSGGSGFLLPDTRKVTLTLDLSRPATGFNYTAADNISLKLAVEPLMGANLVWNGGGEDTTGESSQNTARAVPGWNGDLDVGVSVYGSVMRTTDPGPTDRGKNYFFARTNTTAEVWQRIDLTLAKDRIDSGNVSYKLAAWIGGTSRAQNDASSVKLTFFNGSGAGVGSPVTLGPVLGVDRGNVSALVSKAQEGYVPIGTRIVEVRQAYKYTRAGGYAEAAVDNVFLMLNTAGEVAIRENGIVNAATGVPGAVAPGEMITVYTTGVNLAGTARMQLNPDGYISTNIGQAKLYFDGVEAPMLYVNSSQIGAIVPWQMDGKSSSVVRVEYQGVTSPSVTVNIVPTAPGIFTADGSPKGQGLIYNDGFLPNSEATPVAPGGLATIIWTGGGVTDPVGLNGRIDFNPLPRVVAPVKVTVGGQPAEVLFAGAIPYGWSGLLSAVVKVPAGLATEKPLSVPVVVTAGDSSSPDTAVTMWVKP